MGKWIKDGDQDGDQHDLNEDIEATYAKQDEQDEKDEKSITYTPLGSDVCPIDPEAETIEYTSQYRIPKIENLEPCVNLKVSCCLNC